MIVTATIMRHMVHLFLFGHQIIVIVLLSVDLNRYPLLDRDAIARKTGDFRWIVGEQTQPSRSDISKNLRTDAVIPHIRREAQHHIGFHRIVTLFLQIIGLDFIDQPDAPAFLTQTCKL